jgi:hypothetical protein
MTKKMGSEQMSTDTLDIYHTITSLKKKSRCKAYTKEEYMAAKPLSYTRFTHEVSQDGNSLRVIDIRSGKWIEIPFAETSWRGKDGKTIHLHEYLENFIKELEVDEAIEDLLNPDVC